jgi:hypothetical protein
METDALSTLWHVFSLLEQSILNTLAMRYLFRGAHYTTREIVFCLSLVSFLPGRPKVTTRTLPKRVALSLVPH